MTRPETLVRQLTSAVVSPLKDQEYALRSKTFPDPKLTPLVRTLYAKYRWFTKRTERLKKQLEAAGGMAYTGNSKPRMKADGSQREAEYKAIRGKIARATALRDAAMLAVLGLDAAKARPIVLKLKRDLEALQRGK